MNPPSPSQPSGTGPPKNVVAIGCTGTGKSSTLNTLMGLVDDGNNAIDPTRHFADSSAMNAAGTKLTQSIMGPTKTFDPGQQGGMIRAFDTPGLGDPAGDAQDRLNIANMVETLKPVGEIHLFMLVLNSGTPRLSDWEAKTLRIFLSMFPSQDPANPYGHFFQNLLIVCTHWGNDSRSESNRARQHPPLTPNFVSQEIHSAFRTRFGYSGPLNISFIDNFYDRDESNEVEAIKQVIMDIEVRARVNTPFPTNCVTKVETIMEKNEKKMAEIKEANKKLEKQQLEERLAHEKALEAAQKKFEKTMDDANKTHAAKMEELQKDYERVKREKEEQKSSGLGIKEIIALIGALSMGGGGGGGGGGGMPMMDFGGGGGGPGPHQSAPHSRAVARAAPRSSGATRYRGVGRPRKTDYTAGGKLRR